MKETPVQPENQPVGVRLEPHPADERLALLTLDRPPVNALSQDMWDRLASIAHELHGETPYRAVVIVGEGKHFSVGADIKALIGLPPETFDARNRVLQGALHKIATAPQITIAAIHGYALGGGCELALAADFRIAGRSAKLGLPEITLGIIPGSGGTQRLARAVGLPKAKQLILTGRTVNADEAERIGLIDDVVDDADVTDTAIKQALNFARGPLALRHAKRAITASLDLPIEAGLALEADLITECFTSEDARLGLRAFVDKTPGPTQFNGR